MLQIVIPATEQWDERREEFVYTKQCVLQLEHSLVSLQKWESKWHKPFLSNKEKTVEELMDYIKFMTITQNVDPRVYSCLTEDNYEDIKTYIDDPMTATTFADDKSGSGGRKETITAELIYFWMIANNIPYECRKWHLKQLLTLIQVCTVKNTPPKKRSKKELASQYAAMNAARRKKLNSKG
jgi:hypothetical protein